MTERIELHGGPRDGEFIEAMFGATVIIPEYAYQMSLPFINHEYSLRDGHYIGVRLSEPYSWWTVEPFPRWARLVATLRRLKSLRIRFQ